jgi:Holliday junction resolvasome RuvABC endonuclease subunit
MILLSCDPSLAATGLVLVERKPRLRRLLKSQVLSPARDLGFRTRVKIILDAMFVMCFKTEVDSYGLEIPFLAPGKQKLSTFSEQMGLAQIIRYTLLGHGADEDSLVLVSPSQAKKAMTGKGNATKEEVVETVQSLWGEVEGNKVRKEAICDAIAIAEAAYILRS